MNNRTISLQPKPYQIVRALAVMLCFATIAAMMLYLSTTAIVSGSTMAAPAAAPFSNATNIALNKPVTATSYSGDTLPGAGPNDAWHPSNLTDGGVSSTQPGWASANSQPFPQSATIDLGAPRRFNQMVIQNEFGTGARNIRGYQLLGSNTGAFAGEQITISTGVIPSLGAGAIYTVRFPVAEARFVRIVGISSYSSFIIIGELGLFATDHGDAPDSYATNLADGGEGVGPSHQISLPPTLTLTLGPTVDMESDGQPSGAFGDDSNGVTPDDEDGVTLNGAALDNQALVIGEAYDLAVQVVGSGYLNAWIDWDSSGVFDSGEKIATEQAVVTGTITLTVTPPATAPTGYTYARFRLCDGAGECNTPFGAADSGEVEDYRVGISKLTVTKTGTASSTGSTTEVGVGDTIDWMVAFGVEGPTPDGLYILDDFSDNQNGTLSNVSTPSSWATAPEAGGLGFSTSSNLVTGDSELVHVNQSFNFGNTGGDGYDPVLGAADGNIYMNFHHVGTAPYPQPGVIMCVNPTTGLVCDGYADSDGAGTADRAGIDLLPNGEYTKFGSTPENTLFIGNRFYYPYTYHVTTPTRTEWWGLGCYDVAAAAAAIAGGATKTQAAAAANCDADTNFAGSSWQDGAVELGTGAKSTWFGAIEGPILMGGKLYLLDYDMKMHCVTPEGATCGSTDLSGVTNLETISADTRPSSVAIAMEGWEDRIYFQVLYRGNLDSGDAPYDSNADVVIGCFDTATNSACWNTAPVIKDLTGSNVNNSSSVSSIYMRYDTAGVADGVCVMNRGAGAATNWVRGCVTLDGTAVQPVNTALLALFTTQIGTGGEIYVEDFNHSYFNDFFTNRVICWDWTTNAVCSGWGASGITLGPSGAKTYGIAVEPDDRCAWVLGDDNNLWNFDTLTGASPCLIGQAILEVDLAASYCATDPANISAGWDELAIQSNQFTSFDALETYYADFVIEITDPISDTVIASYVYSATADSFDKSDPGLPDVTLDAVQGLLAVNLGGGGLPWSDLSKLSVKIVAAEITPPADLPDASLSYDGPPPQFCFTTAPTLTCENPFGVVTNQAYAYAGISSPVPTADPLSNLNYVDDSGLVSLNVVSDPQVCGVDLSIDKDDGVTTVIAGSTTTYQVVVTNDGTSVGDGAVVTDPAVAGLSKTSVICGSATGGAVCSAPVSTTVALLEGAGIVIPTFPISSSLTFSVTADITASSGSVTNVATVTPLSGTIDLTPSNNTDDDTDVILNPGYTLSKRTNTPSPVRIGESISFTIRITNTGQVTLSTVPLRDTYVPEELVFLDATPPPNATTVNQLDWSDLTAGAPNGIGYDLAPGQSFVITATFAGIKDTSANPGGVTVNTAAATGLFFDVDGPGGTPPQPVSDKPPVTATVAIVAPTAVSLANASVSYANGDSLLNWRTLNESDVIGFHIYRSMGDGNPVRLTEGMILAQKPGQSEGATYAYTDAGLEQGNLYTYTVEFIGVDGPLGQQAIGELFTGARLFLPTVGR